MKNKHIIFSKIKVINLKIFTNLFLNNIHLKSNIIFLLWENNIEKFWKVGIKMKVKDCMCNKVYCVKPETKIQDVAKLMEQHHVGCIPVCDNNNCICGIITDRDITLRGVACNKDTQLPISEIMTTNVCTCKEDDDMTNVESKMSQNQIRRIPVCNTNNQVVGILTMGNLAQNGQELGRLQVYDTIEDICDCQKNNNAF